jgi:hypothetical protein
MNNTHRLSDEEFMSRAKLRIRVDRVRGRDTPNWIIELVKDGLPIDRHRFHRLRDEEERGTDHERYA